jgi:exonuclease SbcD
MIAGNHDSPDRLAFGSRLMKDQGFHVAGPFAGSVKPLVLEDEAGRVCFYPLPFAEPALMREKLGDPSLIDHDSAVRAALDSIREHHPAHSRSVLLAHAFVVGGTESESERPLSVGGAGTVKASNFDGFNYVALGHLHRPQEIGLKESAADHVGNRGAAPIQYAGSLMKYSFSEATHEKCVKLVEMDASGDCKIESIPLKSRHDVRSIEGHLQKLLDSGTADPNREDFLSITLLDKGAIFDAMGKLREVYPNVLEIRRPFLALEGERGGARYDHRHHSESELFEAFYEQATGEPLSEEQARAFASTVDRIRRAEREAGS